MSECGVRLGNELLEFIPANSKIRPLRDVIVVEPLPANEVLQIPGWKTIRGKVLAVGPGHYEKKYDGPKGKRTKTWDSTHFTPCDVRVGDLVELGGKEIGGFLHTTVRWGRKEVVICREADVCGIVG